MSKKDIRDLRTTIDWFRSAGYIADLEFTGIQKHLDGWSCRRIFNDLGAEVFKIEPPQGDPGRSTEPFYHDERGPEKSRWWFAYNANKRGIGWSDLQALNPRLVL